MSLAEKFQLVQEAQGETPHCLPITRERRGDTERKGARERERVDRKRSRWRWKERERREGERGKGGTNQESEEKEGEKAREMQ